MNSALTMLHHAVIIIAGMLTVGRATLTSSSRGIECSRTLTWANDLLALDSDDSLTAKPHIWARRGFGV